MKIFVLFACFILVSSSTYAAEVVCWDFDSAPEGNPIIEAKISPEMDLDEMKLDLESPIFESFYFEESWGPNPEWPYPIVKSTLENPKGVIRYFRNRSAKGNYIYRFHLGRYSMLFPTGDFEKNYRATLSLSAKDYTEGGNSVLTYDGPANQATTRGLPGKNLRLKCIRR